MIGELLGGLGLFAALGALALAGTALSKLDKQFQELVHVQINPLRDRVMVTESALDELRKALTRLETESQNTKKIQDDTHMAIAQMNEALERLSKSVTELKDSHVNRQHGMNRKIGAR